MNALVGKILGIAALLALFFTRGMAMATDSGISVTFDANPVPYAWFTNDPFCHCEYCAWHYQVSITETRGVKIHITGIKLRYHDIAGRIFSPTWAACDNNYLMAQFGATDIPAFGTLKSSDAHPLVEFPPSDPTSSVEWTVRGIDKDGNKVWGRAVLQYGRSADSRCPDDSDADGVPDISDNCPDTANPDQSDINHNGYGDECDPEYPPYDADADRLDDFWETVVWRSIEIENNPEGDDDNDGLTNIEEMWFYTNPLSADSNGNGINDEEEFDTCGDLVGCVPEDCDDNKPCTIDLCEFGSICTHEPIEGCCVNDTECKTADPCTKAVCMEYHVCGEEPILGCCTNEDNCNDGKICTTDTCLPGHSCLNSQIPNCCEDDSRCQGNEFCNENHLCERVPVIILPGIMGTELKIISSGPCILGNGNCPWPESGSVLFRDEAKFMALDDKGINADVPKGGITLAPGALINVFDSAGKFSAYDNLNGFLTGPDGNYTEGVDLFTYGYDWRKDIDSEALKFAQWLVTKTRHNQPFDVIAHSQGGLLIRSYLQQFPFSNARNIIFLGTPHLGAPKAYSALEGFGNILNEFGGLYLPTSILKFLTNHFPAVYELLPRYPFVYRGGSAPESLDSTYNDATLVGSLVTKANDFHQGIAALIPAERVFQINGSGQRTLRGIEWSDPNCPRSIVDPYGDGTVPNQNKGGAPLTIPGVTYYYVGYRVCSSGPKYGMSCRIDDDCGAPSIYIPCVDNGEHANLPGSQIVQEGIFQILQGSNLNGAAGFFTAPQKSTDANHLTVCSPVSLTITDAAGNLVGLDENGKLNEGIPDSTMLLFGEHSDAFIPFEGNYEVTLKAKESGTFTLIMDHVGGPDDAVIESQTFQSVPVNTKSVAHITLSSSASNSPLTLDINGDGTPDATVTPNAPADPHLCSLTLQDAVANLTLKKKALKSLAKQIKKIEKTAAKGNAQKAGKLKQKLLTKLGKKKSLTQEQVEAIRRIAEPCFPS